jgi:hypothetical protein
MNAKTYCAISATLFTMVSIAHLLRLILGWPVDIAGLSVPMFVSLMGFAVPGSLAIWGFRETRKRP